MITEMKTDGELECGVKIVNTIYIICQKINQDNFSEKWICITYIFTLRDLFQKICKKFLYKKNA